MHLSFPFATAGRCEWDAVIVAAYWYNTVEVSFC